MSDVNLCYLSELIVIFDENTLNYAVREVLLPAEVIINIEGLVYVADWEIDTITHEQVLFDMLVAKAVASDMLEDEPLAEESLTRFRQRLFLSL